MQNQLRFNFFLFVCLLITLLIIQYSVYIYAQYNVPLFEDLDIILFDKYDIKEKLFVNVYHGRYISNFLCCIFSSSIPKSAGMHPIVFYGTIAPLIKGAFLFIIFYQMSMFLYLKRKKDFFIPFLILCLYISFQFYIALKYQDVEYSAFYGFIFPFVFFNLFWYKLVKIINTNDNKLESTGKDSFILTIYAFLTGISTEFTNIVTFFALFLLCLSGKEFFKALILPFSALITGMSLYYLNPGYRSVLGGHAPIFFNFDTFYKECVFIKPFILSCFDVIKKEYILFLIPIFILLIIARKKYKTSQTKNILTAVSLLAGSVFFTLFLISDPSLSPDSTFWTYHFDLVIQYKILFITIILFLFGCLNINKPVEKLLLTIGLAVLIFNSYSVTEIKIPLKSVYSRGLKNVIKEQKDILFCRDRYIYEKINLWSIRKNGNVIIVPDKPSIRFTEREIIYFAYFYDIDIRKIKNLEEFPSLSEAYEYYLKNGGEEIPEEELSVCNFKNIKNKRQINQTLPD